MRIKTKLDIVYNENTKNDITILHLSDIHFNKQISSKKLDKLSNYINNINADYIMITGDTVDDTAIIKDKNKIKELVTFLTDIAKKRPVLISLGNHDIVNDEDFKFFNKINDLYNIYVLNNSSYEDKNIYVSGLTLPTEYYYNITGDESSSILIRELHKNSNIINKLPKDKVKIMLVHSPIKITSDLVMDKLIEFDLILCGHTHGGLVPSWLGFIFRNRGIISPTRELIPKIARGRIDKVFGSKKISVIINDAITRLSWYPCTFVGLFNILYKSSINKIIIRNDK